MTRPWSEAIRFARDEWDIARAWDDAPDETDETDDCETCGGEAMHAYHRDTGWTCPRARAERSDAA